MPRAPRGSGSSRRPRAGARAPRESLRSRSTEAPPRTLAARRRQPKAQSSAFEEYAGREKTAVVEPPADAKQSARPAIFGKSPTRRYRRSRAAGFRGLDNAAQGGGNRGVVHYYYGPESRPAPPRLYRGMDPRDESRRGASGTRLDQLMSRKSIDFFAASTALVLAVLGDLRHSFRC